MEFVKFVGWILSQVYHLLDFKILGFDLSVIQILLGCLLLGAVITFIKNISGVVGSSSSFDKVHSVSKQTTNQTIEDFRNRVRGSK